MKTYIALSILISALFFVPNIVFAQDAEENLSIGNPDGSDYRIQFTATYNTDYCDCNQVGTVNVFENGFLIGPSIFTSSVNNTQYTNFSLYVGPGYSENLDVVVSLSGIRSWPGTSAETFCLTGGCGVLPNCPCGDNFYSGLTSVQTAPLKNPGNVIASVGAFPDKVIITWGKETNFPNGQHDYNVYKDGIEVATISGAGPYTYTDQGLIQGEVHDYTVKTHILSFGDQESTGVVVEGSTFSIDASDGEFINRTRIQWSNVPSATEDIRIERSTHDDLGAENGREELAIMSASATTYNDQDGIPGFRYNYYIIPLDGDGNTIITYFDDGYSRANGSIKGHVKSSLGAGVSEVNINVVLMDTIIAGGASLPPGCLPSVEYCGITDSEGYYEVKDIYYHSGARFAIIPEKSGVLPHGFKPDTAFRSLDEIVKSISGVDFVDTTVFTVSGKVFYPPVGTSCGVENAKILINGTDFGITTDEDGEWDFAISDEGVYTFEVEFVDHSFENSMGDSVTMLLIQSDQPNIDFENKTTDDLNLVVQGGCEASLGDSVRVHIFATGCFDMYVTLDENGFMLIEDLPARKYTVQVDEIYDDGNNPNLPNIMTQIGEPITIDLTLRDSAEMIVELDSMIITPGETITLPDMTVITTLPDTVIDNYTDTLKGELFPEARFIYRSPLEITIDWESFGAVIPDGCSNIILLEQGVPYPVDIEVKETLSDCFIENGFVKIYDDISDLGSNFVRVPIIGGIASYTIIAGEPQINESLTHNHEKFLYVIPEVDMSPKDGVEFWTLVTGVKSNTPSFITRTPEIPMLILHDPPGDNSYSYLEEGQSFKHFFRNEVLLGGDAGFYADLLIGAKIITPFSANGFGSTFKFSVSAGRDNFDRTGIETTITTTKRFQTSDLDNLTGPIGDVYVGAAFNQGFSLAESLTFDTCVASVDIIPAISVESFATTFVYTENHVRNTLIPTFGLLIENIVDDRPISQLSVEELFEANALKADSISWENILRQNAWHRDSLAVFDENISFNAGAIFSSERTIDTVTSTSLEYNQFINTEFAHGAKIDNQFGAWFDSELGVMGAFRASVNVDEGDDTTKVTTVGYVLDDGDIGDFLSVDILEDTAYNVPAFRIKLGTTSCPHEAGTQSRDKVQIKIFPPQLDDVPKDGVANFVASLTNLSESRETREYHARVVSTTNPDGALVRLGGRQINNGPASFFLEYNQTLDVALEIEKGPIASNYQDLGIMFYAPCEYDLWQDNGTLENVDTAFVTVNFQNECTNVSLFKPGNNWLLNQNNNDELIAVFSGYDINNPFLASLHIDIKRNGQGYRELISVDSADLFVPLHQVLLDLSPFEDGNYTLRARAQCKNSVGSTYSSEYQGIIDRTSLAPYGTPSPSDGFLQAGQSISVSYDKVIKCPINYPTEITLIREDTQEEIPITVQCMVNGTEIIIVPDVPLTDDPSLNGVLVTAKSHLLQDNSGNIQKYPVVWSFLVNVKPIFWDPENVYASAIVGHPASIQGTLKNNALLSKAFSLDKADDPIIDYPEWLTPAQTRGTVLSQGDYQVDFVVDPDLLPGIYQGTVTASVDGSAVSMDVTFELLARPVNWSFDGNQYDNSMTIVTQFSLLPSDAPLTTDTRDVVAAFVNGEIRGLANIEYIPQIDKYAAFLTVFSNDDGGNNAEEINFRFWKALSGIEYSAIETVDFQPEGRVGTPGSPLILHPEGILQVIPLEQGWNWISFNLANPDYSREKLFQSIIYAASQNTVTIKTKSGTTAHSNASGWSGSLTNFALGRGYLVHLSAHSDTLRVSGTIPTTPVSIPLADSWNWIGFPEQIARPVDEVLDSIIKTDGDLFKSQYAFSTYDAVVGSWLGNQKEFSPGEGYKLFLGNQTTLVYRDPSDYKVYPGLYEFNMNVTAILDLEELEEPTAEDLIVAAFIDGYCQGLAKVEYVELLDEYRAMLLVHGSPDLLDAEIEFRVLNEKSGVEYIGNGELVTFSNDDIHGTILKPYDLFDFNKPLTVHDGTEYELANIIPNPLNDIGVIPFTLAEEGNVTMSLYDINGQLVKTLLNADLEAGRHQVEVSLGEIQSGLYFYVLDTPGFKATKKLVKN